MVKVKATLITRQSIKGGFLMPIALLTYQIHERQQCHNKQTKLHQIIEVKLIFHMTSPPIYVR